MRNTVAFGETLKAMRMAAGLTQQELADRSGVGLVMLQKCEQGQRMLSQANLARVSEVVAKGDETARQRLYRAAGLEPPGQAIFSLFERGRPEPESIAHQLAGQPWVSLVVNERHEVIGWNGLANEVAEDDLGTMLPTDWDRNLIWMATRRHFQDRLVNWDDLIGRQLWFIRQEGIRVDAADGQGIPPHFHKLIARLQAEDEPTLNRLFGLWVNLPALADGQRNVHPAHWRLEDGTRLNFTLVFRDWSLYDGIFAVDWMAADEATSLWVEAKLAETGFSAWAPIGSPVAPDDFPELFQAARQACGLSRQALATRMGVSANSIYAYERHRPPPRDILLRACKAMVLDGMATNRLLAALRYEPEPAPHARWLAGLLEGPEREPPASVARPIFAELQSFPWPVFLVDGLCHVVDANAAARAVSGIAPTGSEGPHLLQWLLSPEVRERVLNWPDLARAVLPDTLRLQIPDLPDPKPPGAFEREVELLRHSDPAALRDLFDAWKSAPRRAVPIRVAVPIEWAADDGEVQRWHCFLTRWNARDYWWAIDWHPANAAAWAALRRANATPEPSSQRLVQ